MRIRTCSDKSLEFDFRAVGDGRSAQARYANNSNYRNDSLIRKESESMEPILPRSVKLTSSTVCVSSILIAEIKKIIKESEIMKHVLSINTILQVPISNKFYREDDTKWPQKNKDGRQELEIRLGNEHISFEVCFIIVSPLTSHTDHDNSLDCQNRLSCRRQRVRGPRRPTSVLLPGAGPEGAGLLPHIAALQGTSIDIVVCTFTDTNTDQADLS